MKRIKTFSLMLSAVLAVAGCTGLAQVPESPQAETPDTEAAQAPESPQAETPTAQEVQVGSVQRFGRDYTLAEGETAREVVVTGGEAVIEGTVSRDVVSVGGKAQVGPAAEIGGDLVVVAGSLKISPGAAVGGDVVVIGGSMDAPDGFEPGGDLVSLFSLADGAPFGEVLSWITSGLFMGRPIVPSLPWVWVVVLVAALFYLAINFIFERPVRDCSAVLTDKPLTTFLVGVLVLLLSGPLTGLLMVSIIGILAVPLLWFALLLAGLFGRAGVFRWIGGRVMAEMSPGDRLEATRSMAIGMVAICLVYMAPLLGFLAWTAVGVLGVGAAATTLYAGFRREHPALPPSESHPAAGLELEAEPDGAELADGPPVTEGSSEYPAAAFGRRLGAVALDLMLLIVSSMLLDFEGAQTFALFLAYPVVLWGWKTTTIGGIICHLRVVRVDGAPLKFSDSLVRGLSCIVSAVPAGLGWFWIIWDPKKQAWHDKIAGTYVVEVPSSLPLP